MYIYGPSNIQEDRIKKAEKILNSIKAKHCFISGSFLYNKKFKDIDIFVISRSKKIDKRYQIIDFNNLHSLFYHSVSKSCVSKSILPRKKLRVTITNYWDHINETVPNVMNDRAFRKNIRSLVLYTEFLKSGKILDSKELRNASKKLKNKNEVYKFIFSKTPKVIRKHLKKSYINRFFYTLSGFYEGFSDDEAQDFLRKVALQVINGVR